MPTINLIRIFNGCEVRIENSVKRVTVRHHEACRVRPNSYPEWRNFQFAPNSHYGFFFLHTFPSTSAFKLEHALFYRFYAKITVFFIKKCSVRLLSKTLTSKTFGGKWRQKLMLWRQKLMFWRQHWRYDVKKTTWRHERESSYTPSCKTTFPSPGRVHGSGPVCKK